MDDFKDYLFKKLKLYSEEDIVFSDHALIRMVQRQIDKSEVIENILNPVRLEFAVREKSASSSEEKFDCYFGYSKSRCHRYVLVLKKNVVVVTVIKINRRWQRIVEAKLRGV
jgi:hypothetical protein